MDIIDPENPPNSLYSGSSGYPDEPLDWPDILIIVLLFCDCRRSWNRGIVPGENRQRIRVFSGGKNDDMDPGEC
ncbi:hypothetical protein LSH36_192g01046 [Paralvinella palmiformis]|uniref:Uncharacterized protein n=1 Tax=Paralvinella palmiformis TaxID=53620 RepID=A0AAD9JQM7_9ANNE|nr:hypothetical protein LSH36_192g01046 [Paralvinella palmiformis]